MKVCIDLQDNAILLYNWSVNDSGIKNLGCTSLFNPLFSIMSEGSLKHSTLRAEHPFVCLNEEEKRTLCLNRVKLLRSPQPKLLD